MKKNMEKFWESIKRASSVAMVILLLLAIILLLYEFVIFPTPVVAQVTQQKSDVLSKLGPRTAVTLILAMIALVALVFSLFIYFGRRLQTRGYLGPLVGDAIARAEIARQEARLIEDLRSGKIDAELAPGTDEFNKRYGIPANEPIPELRPGIEVDETGRVPRYLGWEEESRTPMPGMPDTADPWDAATEDNHRPGGSATWDRWEFSANLRRGIRDWTAERLVTERNACKPDDNETEDRKRTAKKAIESEAIKDEISRRFRVGYRREQWNTFQKKRAEITDTERKRAEKLLPTVDVSSFGGGWVFVLEFTTIIFIVFAVLSLGLLGILNSEPIAAILAAIAGYVLGKSTSIRGAGGEEIRRGAEEPKALFEALTKQEEIRSLQDEEKIKLRREVEELQRKLAQSKVTVPDVKGMGVGEAETKIKEKSLVTDKKEVENAKAETGKVFDQSPDANIEAAKGSTVVLFVAKKSAAA